MLIQIQSAKGLFLRIVNIKLNILSICWYVLVLLACTKKQSTFIGVNKLYIRTFGTLESPRQVMSVHDLNSYI